MCGIFGYNHTEDTTSDLAKDFTDSLAHRGPDAHASETVGDWTLGHLRLSIIETSSASNQPFHKDGNWLVYNGEIYNYLELKNEYLKDSPLRTESDTEVLITLLNRYGISILNKLNGMFAFGWYDSNTSTLYLCRDRYGVKPLYYTEINERFYFASEMRPLVALQTETTLDEGILNTFFTDTATDFDSRSGIVNIFQVPAGQLLAITADGEKASTLWYHGDDSVVDTTIFTDPQKTINAFEDLLIDAIKLRHRSDVPICITLSGGLDSTTLYVLAKEKLQSKIQPFIFAHPGRVTDESPRAIALAGKYNDTPIVVKSVENNSQENLQEALHYLEYPIWNPSAVAYLDMYTAIKEHGYTVVIEGHGSDEQLGGYPYMLEAAWKQALLRGRFSFAHQLYLTWQKTNNPALGQINAATTKIRDYYLMTKGLLRGLVKSILWPYKRKYLNFDALVRESFDYKILPIVLRTFDRLSMARSLEARCPFMDFRVVEFLRALPLEYKVNEIGSKAILREILKKYGHAEIYQNRSKMGFASDVPALMNEPSNRAFLTRAVNDFNHPKFKTQKQNAVARLQKDTLGWGDAADVWKVAAIAMIEKMYVKKPHI